MQQQPPPPPREEDKFVAPPKRTTPRNLWQSPPDFFYATLCGADAASVDRLVTVMHMIDACVTLLPSDGALFDASFWRHHWMPVFKPTPAIDAPGRACTTLATLAVSARAAALASPDDDAKADSLALVVSNMRLALLAAFFCDYRVRAYFMAPTVSGAHAFLGTRAPHIADVWQLMTDRAQERVRDYVVYVNAFVKHGGDHVAERPMAVRHLTQWTRQLAHDYAQWWTDLTRVPPPFPPFSDSLFQTSSPRDESGGQSLVT